MVDKCGFTPLDLQIGQTTSWIQFLQKILYILLKLDTPTSGVVNFQYKVSEDKDKSVDWADYENPVFKEDSDTDDEVDLPDECNITEDDINTLDSKIELSFDYRLSPEIPEDFQEVKPRMTSSKESNKSKDSIPSTESERSVEKMKIKKSLKFKKYSEFIRIDEQDKDKKLIVKTKVSELGLLERQHDPQTDEYSEISEVEEPAFDLTKKQAYKLQKILPNHPKIIRIFKNLDEFTNNPKLVPMIAPPELEDNPDLDPRSTEQKDYGMEVHNYNIVIPSYPLSWRFETNEFVTNQTFDGMMLNERERSIRIRYCQIKRIVNENRRKARIRADNLQFEELMRQMNIKPNNKRKCED